MSSAKRLSLAEPRKVKEVSHEWERLGGWQVCWKLLGIGFEVT